MVARPKPPLLVHGGVWNLLVGEEERPRLEETRPVKSALGGSMSIVDTSTAASIMSAGNKMMRHCESENWKIILGIKVQRACEPGLFRGTSRGALANTGMRCIISGYIRERKSCRHKRNQRSDVLVPSTLLYNSSSSLLHNFRLATTPLPTCLFSPRLVVG